MTLLEEFAYLAAELGLGTYTPDAPGGTIYTVLLPPDPDTCIAIARSGGAESLVTDDFDQPSIQIRIRGSAADTRTAEHLAERVYKAFHGLGPRTLAGGSTLILAVCTQSGPVYIGPDQLGRHEYTVNMRCELRKE